MLGDAEETDNYSVGFVFNEDMNTLQCCVRADDVPLPLPRLVQPDGTLRVTMLNLYEQMPGQSIGRSTSSLTTSKCSTRWGDSRPTSSRPMLVMLIKLGSSPDSVSAATFRVSRGLSVILRHLHGGHARSLSGRRWVLRADRGQSNGLDKHPVAIQWVFKMGIRQIARASVFMLEAFGEYRPATTLS